MGRLKVGGDEGGQSIFIYKLEKDAEMLKMACFQLKNV